MISTCVCSMYYLEKHFDFESCTIVDVGFILWFARINNVFLIVSIYFAPIFTSYSGGLLRLLYKKKLRLKIVDTHFMVLKGWDKNSPEAVISDNHAELWEITSRLYEYRSQNRLQKIVFLEFVQFRTSWKASRLTGNNLLFYCCIRNWAVFRDEILMDLFCKSVL